MKPAAPPRLRRRLLLAAPLWLSAARAFAQAPTGEVVAVYPPGNFLENLLVQDDGSVLFTSYFAREVGQFTEAGRQGVFARLEAHPVSLAPAENGGTWVAAHGTPFIEGPKLVGTGMLVLLDRTGTAERTIALPMTGFPNGMLADGGNFLLLADSIVGCIWRIDTSAGTATKWLELPEMAPLASRPGFPGVNGIKRVPGSLFFSNSARPGIWRVPLDNAGRPAGPASSVIELASIDDFWPMPDGGFIVATHAATVLRVTPDGVARVLLAADIDGNTAVALAPAPDGGQFLYVTATGGLIEGKGLPANLVRLRLPR